MYGTVLGIPLAIVVFLATNHYLMEWDLIGDRLAVTLVGAGLAICVYFVIRGIDTYLDKKRDNPEPFYTSAPIPPAFGAFKEIISEGSFGPFFWGLKTVDPDEGRLMGVLNFTELMGAGLQAKRLMMVQILFESVPEEQQKPLNPIVPDEKGVTKIQINWLVDSPMNRFTVNKIIDEMTLDFKRSLGLAAAAKVQEKSPFEPPLWAMVFAGLAILYAVHRMDGYTHYKAEKAVEIKEQAERQQAADQERAQARQRATDEQARRQAYDQEMADKYRAGQEEQRRKAQELLEQERGNFGSNPQTTREMFRNRIHSPFAAPLTPGSSNTDNPAPWRKPY